MSIQISPPAFILWSTYTSQIFEYNLLSQPYSTSCESVCFKRKCHKTLPAVTLMFSILGIFFFFFSASQTTQIHFCQPRFTRHSKGYWPTNEILLITCAKEGREGKDMTCRGPATFVAQAWSLRRMASSSLLTAWRGSSSFPFYRRGNQGLSKDLPPRSLSAVRPLSGPPCPTG